MIAFLMCLGLTAGVNGALKAETSAKQLSVEVRVCQGDPLGSREARTVRHLVESKVATRSGRSTSVLAGGQTPIHGGEGKVVFEETGIRAEVLPVVYPKGVIWVEVNTTLRAVNVGLGNGWMPGFSEQSQRDSRIVTAGETFRIRISAAAPTDQTWVEVTIREQSPVAK